MVAVYQQPPQEAQQDIVPFKAADGNQYFGAHVAAMKALLGVGQPRTAARQVNIDLPRFFRPMMTTQRSG